MTIDIVIAKYEQKNIMIKGNPAMTGNCIVWLFKK